MQSLSNHRIASLLFATIITLSHASHSNAVDLPLRGENGEFVLGLGTTEVAQFSPDSRWIVSGGELGAFLWDAQTGELIRHFQNDGGLIISLDISSDSKSLLTGSSSVVTLWDLESGEKIRELARHPDGFGVQDVDLSPNNQMTAIASDQSALVFDVQTGELIHELKGDHNSVSVVEFSPDNKKLLTSDREEQAHLWDLDTETILQTFPKNSSRGSIDYSPDGKWIAIPGKSEDRLPSVKIWNANTGNMVHELKKHNMGIKFMKFLSDSNTLYMNMFLSTPYYFDIQTGEFLDDYKASSQKMQDFSLSLNAALTLENGLSLLELDTGEHLTTFQGHYGQLQSLDLTSDGSRALTGHESKAVHLWDTATGEILQTINTPNGNIAKVQFSPNQQWIVTHSPSTNIHIWDAQTGELHFQLPETDYSSVTFSSDSQTLIVGHHNAPSEPQFGIISRWQINPPKKIEEFQAALNLINKIIPSPDNSFFALETSERRTAIWTSDSNQPIAGNNTDSINASLEDIIPDTQNLLVKLNNQARIYNPSGTELIQEYFTSTHDLILGYRFISTDDTVVSLEKNKKIEQSGVENYELILRNVQSNQEISLHNNVPIFSNQFDISNNGEVLIFGGNGFSPRIWRIENPPTSISNWALH